MRNLGVYSHVCEAFVRAVVVGSSACKESVMKYEVCVREVRGCEIPKVCVIHYKRCICSIHSHWRKVLITDSAVRIIYVQTVPSN